MKERPHDGGAYNNVLPAHVEASICNQAGKCETFRGCVEHGCHGACLPEDEPAAPPAQTPPPRLTDDEIGSVLESPADVRWLIEADPISRYRMFARAIETAVRKQAGWE